MQRDGPQMLLIFDLCQDLLNNMRVIKRKKMICILYVLHVKGKKKICILYVLHVISHESHPHFTRPKTF